MPTFLQSLYCLLYYLFVGLIGYNGNINRRIRREPNPNLTLFMVLATFLYVLTYFIDTDYFHYEALVQDYSQREVFHVEPVYGLIAAASFYNYILFRIIVWGGALLLFCKTVKISHTNLNHALYTLFIIFIGIFAYARATLGMAFAYCGLALIVQNPPGVKKILGFGLLLCSIIFHSSMALIIGVAIISLIMPLNKKTLLISLVSTAIGAVAITGLFISILTDNQLGDAYVMSKLYTYTSGNMEDDPTTMLGKIKYSLAAAAYYLGVFFCIQSIFKLKAKGIKVSKLQEVFTKCALLIILLSTLLLFLPLGVNVFAYRIRYMAMIPICICLTSMTDKGLISLSKYRLCMGMGAAAMLMALLYNVKDTV
ncbi:MAG: hypothetical protein K2I91_06735 [Muribaculaceae bacterium]|nr:hypothetical protein [Muribaculaceae bacterium]